MSRTSGTRLSVFAFAILGAVAAANAQSGGGYVITKSTIDSGGHSNLTDVAGTYKLAGTVGQHDAGELSDISGTYSLTGGFWSPAATGEPPPTIIWDSDPLSLGRTSRSLRFTAEAPVTATGSAGQSAIKVTMVDLAHPSPANSPLSVTRRCSANLDLCTGTGQGSCPSGQTCDLYNFSAYDTRNNGVCVGGSHAGHHCDVDADCRVCTGGTAAFLGRLCTSDADCGTPPPAGSCPAGGTCSSLTMCTAAGEAVPADASGQGGCARWVGEPKTYRESQLLNLGTYRAARLQCTPFYHDWGSEGLVHVVGGEIVPSSTYEVQNYSGDCIGNEETCTFVSQPLTIRTGRFGDVVADFNPPTNTARQPDGTDIAKVVDKFKQLPTAPSKAIMLLTPNLPELNVNVGGADIVQVVDAFKLVQYRLIGPCPCPSAATCGMVSCANDTVCKASALAGLGKDATCVLTCSSGDNAGDPCINNTHCPPSGTCGNGFCRDRCERCNP